MPGVGFPAARVGDPTTHDMLVPSGVIAPPLPVPCPLCATQPVMIEGMPAAHVGMSCVCSGALSVGMVHPPPPPGVPPPPIVTGSATVFVHGKPAARWAPSGDMGACGVFLGDPKLAAARTVLIGGPSVPGPGSPAPGAAGNGAPAPAPSGKLGHHGAPSAAGATPPPVSPAKSASPGVTATPSASRIPGASDEEHAIDEVLRGEGRNVSPNVLEGQPGAGRQGDRIVDGVLTEYKSVSRVEKQTADALSGAIARRVMDGRGQASQIIVDTRKQAGMTEAIARRGVARAFGADNRTGATINSIRVIGHNFDIIISRK